MFSHSRVRHSQSCHILLHHLCNLCGPSICTAFTNDGKCTRKTTSLKWVDPFDSSVTLLDVDCILHLFVFLFLLLTSCFVCPLVLLASTFLAYSGFSVFVFVFSCSSFGSCFPYLLCFSQMRYVWRCAHDWDIVCESRWPPRTLLSSQRNKADSIVMIVIM